MGSYAPENLSPVSQDIKFNLTQAIPIASLPPLLSFAVSLSHVHTLHNSVAQLTLLRSLQGVSVLSHARPYKKTTPPSSTLLLFLRHTDLAGQVLTACFIQWPLPIFFSPKGHAVTPLLLHSVFPWIRVTLAKLSWSCHVASKVRSWPEHHTVSF